MNIRPATYEDIPRIRENADKVFRHTYAEILTPEQISKAREEMKGFRGLRGRKPNQSND